MPRRKLPIITGEIYHVFNRSVARQQIFQNGFEYERFINSLDFYRFQRNPYRFSEFYRLKPKYQARYLDSLYMSREEVEILSFCIMPNHYHLLLKQLNDNGITNFIRLVQNSYAKYKNIKTDRIGALFQAAFKAVLIETEEQLTHIARYIHLNPFSSNLIQSIEELTSYPWTSYRDYISNKPRKLLNTSYLAGLLNGTESFAKFTTDHADYQRSLEKLKHLF